MLSPARMIAAKVTPAPGVGEQVATDLKAATEGAKSILDKFPEFFSHLLISAIVLVIGLLIIKLGKKIIAGLTRRRSKNSKVNSQRSETFRSIITSIFSYIMFFILVTIILSIFGVDVTSLLAAAGVVGIALAFGAQTLVKDLLAGLFIWGEGTIAVGDLVSINDLDGTVESITIRTTSIRNYNGNVNTIPNGDIRMITNMSRGFKRAIVNVPCPYEENQERLVAMIREEMEIAAQEVPEITAVPDVMSIVSFETHAVMVHVAVPCEIGKHWQIEREIRTRVKNRFDREGIVMPHFSLPEVK